jgi:DNA polymerase-3 subunit gamma/tau
VENEFPRMYQVLKTHLPEQKTEHQLRVKLDNVSQQKDFMEKVHSRLTAYLKEHLKNSLIKLEVEVVEELSNQQLVYTTTDKYNYLAEKNELLHKLKQNFNLDFE